MDYKTLIVAVAVILVLAGGYMLYTQQGAVTTPVEPEVTGEAEESAVLDVEADVKAVVTDYMNYFEQAAPPEADTDAADNAYDLLTERAQSLKEEGIAVSSYLAQFSGVQDLPDEGFEIDFVATGPGDTKEVTTTWKYSGGAVQKVFYLENVDGDWFIDSIQDIR